MMQYILDLSVTLRRLLLKLTPVAAILIIVPTSVEGVARLLHLAPPLVRQYGGMIDDPVLPFRPSPASEYVAPAASNEFAFTVQHNSVGYRDVEHELEKPTGVKRIFAVGDSFTYGAGAPFEGTYLYHLEQRITASNPGWEVIKAGIPRYFPEPERLLLETEGLAYSPDVVIVGFTPNDVIDTVFGMDFVKRDPSGFLKTREADELGGLGHWLYLKSHASRILLQQYVSSQIAKHYPVKWGEMYLADGFHEQQWREVENQYDLLNEAVRMTGARLVILHIPHRGPWGPAQSYPAQRLAAWCERNGATFLDALPALKRAMAAGTDDLYWKVDPHCTATGYRIVGETLFQGLVEHQMIDENAG